MYISMICHSVFELVLEFMLVCPSTVRMLLYVVLHAPVCVCLRNEDFVHTVTVTGFF